MTRRERGAGGRVTPGLILGSGLLLSTRHPEEPAKQAFRRMATNTERAAILRDARKRSLLRMRTECVGHALSLRRLTHTQRRDRRLGGVRVGVRHGHADRDQFLNL